MAIKEYSGDALVCDIVDAHPNSKAVLESFGLPCYRCVVAYSETLAEGLLPHEIALDEVLARLNADAPLNQSSGPRRSSPKGAL